MTPRPSIHNLGDVEVELVSHVGLISDLATRTVSFDRPSAIANPLTAEMLTSWSDNTSAIHKYIDGTWTNTGNAGVGTGYNWYIMTGPAVAAAAYWRLERAPSTQYLAWAKDTINTAIATYARPNKSFGYAAPNDNAIGTMEFMRTIGATYLLLGADLDVASRVSWRNALDGASDFLEAAGNLLFYTNGNINIGNTAAFWFAWACTGNAKHYARYLKSLDFIQRPENYDAKWTGFGLTTTVDATVADGSDGEGYFTESPTSTPPAADGGSGVGFDWMYSSLQMDVLSQLYLFSRDPKILFLLNLVFNKLWNSTHVNTTTYVLSGLLGSRTNLASIAFWGAVPVIINQGGRTPASANITTQFNNQLRDPLRAAKTGGAAGLYRTMGNVLATLALSEGNFRIAGTVI